MTKICLIGISGVGKSYWARKLSARLHLPLVHYDTLCWEKNWTEVEERVVYAKLRKELQRDAWILEGYIAPAAKERLEAADVVLYLDYPGWRAALGGLRRWWQHRKNPRPERPGVYIFEDKEGNPLYIGKSIHLRERVCQHFAKAHSSAKELALVMRTHRIVCEETVSELGALLLESQMVKERLPVYNRRLRREGGSIVLVEQEDEAGYLRPAVRELREMDPREFGTVLGIYRSHAQMKKQLSSMHKDKGLCSHMLGVSKGKGPCFSYHLGTCHGPCVGEESASSYNERLREAFTATRIRRWPHQHPLCIRHLDEEGGRVECVIVHDWCVLGVATYEGGDWSRAQKLEKRFDRDVYRILRQFLQAPAARGGVCIPLTPNTARGDLGELLDLLELTDLAQPSPLLSASNNRV